MILRFLEELKRRRLIAVVTWYVLAVWVALQVADVLGPLLGSSDAALRFVVYLSVLGLPVALFLGWRYDFRGGQIRQTAPASSGKQNPLGTRDFLLLGLAAIAVVAIGSWALRQAREAPVMETIGAPNSIAVLMFDDRTGAHAPLARDISDQLVTTLIANANLSVSGRSSSFYFADHPAELDRIAHLLQSRHLLTGELKGEPEAPTLRVELLSMPTEDMLLARDLPVDPERPWKLYLPISNEVTQAMGVTPTSGLEQTLDDTVTLYLRRARMSETPLDGLGWLEKAAEAAPDSAYVWSQMAFGQQMALANGSVPVPTALAAAREALDRARELGANDWMYHWMEGVYQRRIMRFQGVTPEREQAFVDSMERAIALNPSDATPFLSYSIFPRLQRRYDRAGELLLQGLERDPLHASLRMQYSRILSAQGESEQALSWALQLPSLFDCCWEDVAARYFERGELDRAAWWQWRWPNKNDYLQWHMATTWMEMRAPEDALATLNGITEDSYIRPRADILHAEIEGRDAEALALALAHIDGEAADQDQGEAVMRAARLAHRLDDYALTMELIEQSHPGLADPLAPQVQEQNVEAALLLAATLRDKGDQDVREGVLASAILATTRNRPVMGFDGIGDRAIRVHAYRGEAERAVALLQSAYDEGFRSIYNDIGRLPCQYESLADDPDFKRILGQLDSEITRMRENVRGWIRDGVDFVGPPPEELAQL